MPVYEYRCKGCGKTHEIEQGFHDERPTKCPACGAPLARVFHPVGVVFKGSGFYKTDSSRAHASKDPAAGSEAAKSDGKADAPKSDAPKSDAPKSDAPKADAPKSDGPKKSETKPASEGSSGTAKTADVKSPPSSSNP